MSRLDIGSAIRADLFRAAAAGYPREACGILFGRVERDQRIVEGFRPTRNRWSGRADRYRVDPESLRHALSAEDRGGPRVLGFYHSHPDAAPVPSITDREWAWPWYVYLIVRVENGVAAEARAWELDSASDRFLERPIEYT